MSSQTNHSFSLLRIGWVHLREHYAQQSGWAWLRRILKSLYSCVYRRIHLLRYVGSWDADPRFRSFNHVPASQFSTDATAWTWCSRQHLDDLGPMALDPALRSGHIFCRNSNATRAQRNLCCEESYEADDPNENQTRELIEDDCKGRAGGKSSKSTGRRPSTCTIMNINFNFDLIKFQINNIH